MDPDLHGGNSGVWSGPFSQLQHRTQKRMSDWWGRGENRQKNLLKTTKLNEQRRSFEMLQKRKSGKRTKKNPKTWKGSVQALAWVHKLVFFTSVLDAAASGDLDYSGRAAWTRLMFIFGLQLLQLFRKTLRRCFFLLGSSRNVLWKLEEEGDEDVMLLRMNPLCDINKRLQLWKASRLPDTLREETLKLRRWSEA